MEPFQAALLLVRRQVHPRSKLGVLRIFHPEDEAFMFLRKFGSTRATRRRNIREDSIFHTHTHTHTYICVCVCVCVCVAYSSL
jgi:hypothetical protein